MKKRSKTLKKKFRKKLADYKAFGMWKNRDDLKDVYEFVDKMRSIK